MPKLPIFNFSQFYKRQNIALLTSKNSPAHFFKFPPLKKVTAKNVKVTRKTALTLQTERGLVFLPSLRHFKANLLLYPPLQKKNYFTPLYPLKLQKTKFATKLCNFLHIFVWEFFKQNFVTKFFQFFDMLLCTQYGIIYKIITVIVWSVFE